MLYIYSVYILQVGQYKRGKKKIMNFFIGQVQKQLNGKADGKAVIEILQRHLSSDINNSWQIRYSFDPLYCTCNLVDRNFFHSTAIESSKTVN